MILIGPGDRQVDAALARASHASAPGESDRGRRDQHERDREQRRPTAQPPQLGDPPRAERAASRRAHAGERAADRDEDEGSTAAAGDHSRLRGCSAAMAQDRDPGVGDDRVADDDARGRLRDRGRDQAPAPRRADRDEIAIRSAASAASSSGATDWSAQVSNT